MDTEISILSCHIIGEIPNKGVQAKEFHALTFNKVDPLSCNLQ